MAVIAGDGRRTDVRGRGSPSAVLINAPYCPHTLAAAYATAVLREWGIGVVPLDFEFDFSVRRPDLWRAVRAVFNPYAPSELPRVQFVLRPELLVYSLFRAHGRSAPPPGVAPVELDLHDELSPYIDDYAALAIEQGASTYLFSTIGSNLWFVLRLAQAICRRQSGARVVLGGPAIQNAELRAFLAALPFVHDFVVAAHPEELRAELARCFDVPVQRGVWDRAAFEALPAPDLNGWPLPGASIRDYGSRPAGATRQVPITGSIGCPYRCAFCFDSIGAALVSRRPAHVVAEMAWQISRTGSNLFVFCDPTLNFHEGWLHELGERIAADLPACYITFAHFRMDRMSLGLLDAIARARVTHMNFGLESFHLPQRQRMVKDGGSDVDAEEILIEALRRGISVSVNLMSEYDRHDADAYAAQLAGITRLRRHIARYVSAPRIQFIVSRLRVEPHSSLYRGQLADRVQPFAIDWPSDVPDEIRQPFEALLQIWDRDYDPQRTHAEYQALADVASASSSGGGVFLPEMSLFDGDSVFEPWPQVRLLRDETGRAYLERDHALVIRLDDEGVAVWRALVAGRPMRELEAGRDDSVRRLLCVLLEERCIRRAYRPVVLAEGAR